jgi:hypothetical protein
MIIGVSALRPRRIAGLHGLTLVIRGGVGCSRSDVILAVGTLSVAALQRETRTFPIVFNSVSDPVGAGFVDNLARPDGNTTGFIRYPGSVPFRLRPGRLKCIPSVPWKPTAVGR